MDSRSNDSAGQWFLAAYDRGGRFMCLYHPSDFTEDDLPLMTALHGALSGLAILAHSGE